MPETHRCNLGKEKKDAETVDAFQVKRDPQGRTEGHTGLNVDCGASCGSHAKTPLRGRPQMHKYGQFDNFTIDLRISLATLTMAKLTLQMLVIRAKACLSNTVYLVVVAVVFWCVYII